jgi:hypothetical protein
LISNSLWKQAYSLLVKSDNERIELGSRRAGRGVWSRRWNELLPAIGDGPVDGLALIGATAVDLERQTEKRVWPLQKCKSDRDVLKAC